MTNYKRKFNIELAIANNFRIFFNYTYKNINLYSATTPYQVRTTINSNTIPVSFHQQWITLQKFQNPPHQPSNPIEISDQRRNRKPSPKLGVKSRGSSLKKGTLEQPRREGWKSIGRITRRDQSMTNPFFFLRREETRPRQWTHEGGGRVEEREKKRREWKKQEEERERKIHAPASARHP